MTNEYIGYKIQLHNLTDEQKKKVRELSDARITLYNMGIDYCRFLYSQGKSCPSYISLCYWISSLIENPKYRWLKKYNRASLTGAMKDLSNAFNKFFKKICAFPKKKNHYTAPISYTVRSNRIRFSVDGKYVYIPGISKRSGNKDLVYCGNHNIPYGNNIKYYDARLKYDKNKYWLCLTVKLDDPIPEYTIPFGTPLGIDVGIRNSATLSDGTVYESPNKHRINILQKRCDRLSKSIHEEAMRMDQQSKLEGIPFRKIPRSKNSLKREFQLNKWYKRITNIYKSHYHKISKEIANKQAPFVVLETIDIRRLQRENPNTSHYIHQAGLSRFISYIEYKCRNAGTKVIRAYKGYKSTQICSNCGHEYDIGKQKYYKCPFCGLRIDRDLNAAINLLDYGLVQEGLLI